LAELSIVPAKPEYADSLTAIAIAAKSYWKYPARWIELWTPQLTFSPDYFLENESWMLEKDGVPIAFYTLLDKDGIEWIENLWILPDYIGKGLGRQLFEHAMNLARTRGYTLLQLEAEPNAIGFYEKMGMRRIGEHQYELEGQPRILPLMEISL
jgi:ribosomal protein S18 acetylase RimI-like enzyme